MTEQKKIFGTDGVRGIANVEKDTVSATCATGEADLRIRRDVVALLRTAPRTARADHFLNERRQILSQLRAVGGRLDVLFGMDEQVLAAIVLGCRGAVGSGYNFAALIKSQV